MIDITTIKITDIIKEELPAMVSDNYFSRNRISLITGGVVVLLVGTAVVLYWRHQKKKMNNAESI